MQGGLDQFQGEDPKGGIQENIDPSRILFNPIAYVILGYALPLHPVVLQNRLGEITLGAAWQVMLTEKSGIAVGTCFSNLQELISVEEGIDSHGPAL